MKTYQMILEKCSSVPWLRSSWHGSFLSLDGAEIHDFTYEDVYDGDEQDALMFGDGVGECDGHCCAVFRLKDGRWVAYESSWGPTGSGFHEDAYGGDANITFARTRENAIRLGLSQSSRKDWGLE